MRLHAPQTPRRCALAVLALVVCLLGGPLVAQTASAPPLTAANLTRLRMLTTSAEAARFPADLALLLGLGAEPIMAKQLVSSWRGGEITLAFLDTPRGEVVITAKDSTRLAVYLTDATRELRAAVMVDGSGQRRVTNLQAAAAFTLTLQRWNELAIEDAAARK